MKKDKKKLKSNEIFYKFKNTNIPLPTIQKRIDKQNKLIERILREMDETYSIRKFTKEKKHKSQKKSRNILNMLKFDNINEKINIGPVTYLTYKESQDDDLNVSKYTFEDLRKKLVDSKNFRIGFYTMKNKKFHLPKNFSNVNLTDRRTNHSKKKLSISPYNEYKNFKNKKKNKIFEYKNKAENEFKDEFSNNIYSDINSEKTENKNNKSKFKEMKTISSFNDNNKDNSDINDTNINFLSINNKSHSSRNWMELKKTYSLPYRTNIRTFYNKTNSYKSEVNIKNRYNMTKGYFDKKKPVDLKEKNIKNKTSNKTTDYKDLLKYYKSENNFVNNTKSNNSNSNNIQIKPIDMVNKLFDIKDVVENQQSKLNYLARKNLKLKLIEKKLKKYIVSNSVIDLLAGKHKKIKLRAKINKMKKQIKHLFIVDQIEKFSDNIPFEKLKTFHEEYTKKSEKIGISENIITLNNGKSYHQPKSESKKLNEKVAQNYLEIYRLRNQIITDRYYLEEKDLKYKKLGEEKNESRKNDINNFFDLNEENNHIYL